MRLPHRNPSVLTVRPHGDRALTAGTSAALCLLLGLAASWWQPGVLCGVLFFFFPLCLIVWLCSRPRVVFDNAKRQATRYFFLASRRPVTLALGTLQGVRLDRQRGSAIVWRLAGFWRRRYQLNNVDEVALTCEIVSTKANRFFVYYVRLMGPDGPVAIYRSYNKQQAREAASKAAAFLEVPLRDHLKTPEGAGGIADWLAAHPTAREDFTAPLGARIERRQRGAECVFSIRPSRQARIANGVMVCYMVAAVAVSVLLAFSLIGAPAPDLLIGTACIFGVLALATTVGVPAGITLSVWGSRETVIAAAGEVRVLRRWLLWRSVECKTLDEIQSAEIGVAATPAYTKGFHDLAPREAVRLRGPGDSLEFGGWLRPEDRAWLRDAVVRVICSGSNQAAEPYEMTAQ